MGIIHIFMKTKGLHGHISSLFFIGYRMRWIAAHCQSYDMLVCVCVCMFVGRQSNPVPAPKTKEIYRLLCLVYILHIYIYGHRTEHRTQRDVLRWRFLCVILLCSGIAHIWVPPLLRFVVKTGPDRHRHRQEMGIWYMHIIIITYYYWEGGGRANAYNTSVIIVMNAYKLKRGDHHNVVGNICRFGWCWCPIEDGSTSVGEKGSSMT